MGLKTIRHSKIKIIISNVKTNYVFKEKFANYPIECLDPLLKVGLFKQIISILFLHPLSFNDVSRNENNSQALLIFLKRIYMEASRVLYYMII